ncbi:hypothetical protein [Pseudomonas sp. 21LCFQ010]|nr:hypothetical protein [Pseudomonas sp. 21LCFQ010]
MSTLKRFRNDCDYELDRVITRKKTELSVAQAQILIEKLGRL